jgi:hypothetical protein
MVLPRDRGHPDGAAVSKRVSKRPLPPGEALDLGALGGTRTPNLLIRSQMLYPLSYERTILQYTAVYVLTSACLRRPVASTAVIERLIF